MQVEPTGESDFGPCACCGRTSRKIWGFVHAGEPTVARYSVHWTPGHVDDHGAMFDLIVGLWGDGTDASHRLAVSLDYRVSTHGPGFFVIDAGHRPTATREPVGRALKRDEVIGTPLAQSVFMIVDAVLAHDDRTADLRRASGG